MDFIIGRKIREKRKALGLTQKQLADKIGLSLSPIHYLEMGSPSVSIGNAKLILSELNLELIVVEKNPEPTYLPPHQDNKITNQSPNTDNKKINENQRRNQKP